jgi:hypothetical protein
VENFPNHIGDIVALVLRAAQSIVIHVDAVDYGSFRNFELHCELVKALFDQARSGKRVEFLFLTSSGSERRGPILNFGCAFDGFLRH